MYVNFADGVNRGSCNVCSPWANSIYTCSTSPLLHSLRQKGDGDHKDSVAGGSTRHCLAHKSSAAATLLVAIRYGETRRTMRLAVSVGAGPLHFEREHCSVESSCFPTIVRLDLVRPQTPAGT